MNEEALLKFRADPAAAAAFLEQRFGAVSGLEELAGGELTTAFGFEAAGERLVVRFGSRRRDFDLDRFAYEHFRSERVPVPRLVEIGEALGGCYAVSERCPGVASDRLPPERLEQAAGRIADTVAAVAATDIGRFDGFGYLDDRGAGTARSWRDVVAAELEELARHGPADPGLLAQAGELSRHCFEVRRLVHGDFGLNNLLVAGGAVSGVIDWGQMLYGDFAYDLAWLAYWSADAERAGVDYAGLAAERYAAAGLELEHLSERVLCYQLVIGLGAAGFFAGQGRDASAAWSLARCFELAAAR